MNDFKKLLLKLANLRSSDQRWILSQLSSEQQNQFKQLQGEKLLSQANAFRKLPCPDLPGVFQSQQLPSFVEKLSQLPMLYIAIVLEQGNYAWQNDFLDKFQLNGLIGDETLSAIKPGTKQILYQQWLEQLTFNDHLEPMNFEPTTPHPPFGHLLPNDLNLMGSDLHG